MHSSCSFPCTSTAVFCYSYWVCILVEITGKTNCQPMVFIHTKRCGETTPWTVCASALLGCISAAVTWHAGCIGNMRVSLVKCRSCRTGCSCTAETGICTVPGGAVRNTWGTAPEGGENTWWSTCIFSRVMLIWQPVTSVPHLCLGPVRVTPAWPRCPGRRRWAQLAPRPGTAWRRTSLCGGWGTSCDPPQMLALTRWQWLLGDSLLLEGEQGRGDGKSTCHAEGKRCVCLLASRWRFMPIFKFNLCCMQWHRNNSFETRADWNRERNKMTKCHFEEALDAVHQTFKWNFSEKTYTFYPEDWNLNNETGQHIGSDIPVEFVEVWEISGLLSLLEVDWVLGWTWIAWSCWGTPAPGDTQRANSHSSKSSNTPHKEQRELQ